MLLLFYGDNHYAAERKIREAVARYLEKAGNDFGLERIDAAEVEPSHLHELLTSAPFLATSRLVILKNATQVKEVGEKLISFLDTIPDTTNVIFYEAKPDKRTKLFKTLMQKAQPAEFKTPEGRQLIGWVQQTAREHGGQIEGGAAQRLVERVGSDLVRLDSEIAKLSLQGNSISISDIDSLIEPSLEESIFALTDALTSGDEKGALDLYRQLRANKNDALYILNMIGWQLRSLLKVASVSNKSVPEIAKLMNLSPYVVRKSLGVIRKTDFESIKQAHGLLADADARIKSERVDTDQLVEQMIARSVALLA